MDIVLVQLAPLLSQNGDLNALNIGESMKTREQESSRNDKHKDHDKDNKQMWSLILMLLFTREHSFHFPTFAAKGLQSSVQKH